MRLHHRRPPMHDQLCLTQAFHLTDRPAATWPRLELVAPPSWTMLVVTAYRWPGLWRCVQIPSDRPVRQ